MSEMKNKSDKERVIELLDSLAIGYKIEADDRFGDGERIDSAPGMPNVGGYSATVSWFFDSKGDFVVLNVWV